MTPEERRRAGGTVAERMNELGLTVSQLARKAGLDATTVRAVIHGTRWPRESTRRKLAAALGWEVGDVARLALNHGQRVEDLPTEALIGELCRRYHGAHDVH